MKVLRWRRAQPAFGSMSLALLGERIAADRFVYALGPWLPKLFPDVIGPKILPTRQEVFYLHAARRSSLPSRNDAGMGGFNGGDIFYGFPDLETRGVKFAHDQHGIAVDPTRRTDARRPRLSPRLSPSRSPFSRAKGRATDRRRSLPVRKQLQRRLPGRLPSAIGKRAAGRRRVRSRLQAWPGGRPLCRRPAPRFSQTRTAIQSRYKERGAPPRSALIGLLGNSTSRSLRLGPSSGNQPAFHRRLYQASPLPSEFPSLPDGGADRALRRPTSHVRCRCAGRLIQVRARWILCRRETGSPSCQP